MARALYRLPVAAWTAELRAVALELHRAAGQVFVLAATDPSPELEAAGATRLGARLVQLLAAVRTHFSCARVRRSMLVDGAPQLVDVTVRTADVLGDDVVLEADVPRVIFAGDDPAGYR